MAWKEETANFSGLALWQFDIYDLIFLRQTLVNGVFFSSLCGHPKSSTALQCSCFFIYIIIAIWWVSAWSGPTHSRNIESHIATARVMMWCGCASVRRQKGWHNNVLRIVIGCCVDPVPSQPAPKWHLCLPYPLSRLQKQVNITVQLISNRTGVPQRLCSIPRDNDTEWWPQIRWPSSGTVHNQAPYTDFAGAGLQQTVRALLIAYQATQGRTIKRVQPVTMVLCKLIRYCWTRSCTYHSFPADRTRHHKS